MKYAYYPGCSLHASAAEYDMSWKAVCERLDIQLNRILQDETRKLEKINLQEFLVDEDSNAATPDVAFRNLKAADLAKRAVRDLTDSIHPHPTLTETLGVAAEVYLGTATDLYRPKR